MPKLVDGKFYTDVNRFRGSFSGRERDVFFLNPGDNNRFFSTAFGLGLDFLDDGRSVAALDFDNDGDLDLIRASLTRIQLLENRLSRKDRNSIRLHLTAVRSHSAALGAEVIIEAGGIIQRDFVKITTGFQTQVPRSLHFGLGAQKTISKMTIQWPSGREQVFQNIPANTVIQVTEDNEEPTISSIKRWGEERESLPIGQATLSHTLPSLEGPQASLETSEDIVTVVNFWAPWCKPCADELPTLAKLAKEMPSVRFVGVSAELSDRKSIKKAVKDFGLKYEQFIATDDLYESFFGVDSKAQLPSTFIFDASGQLHQAFLAKIGEKQLRASLESARAARPNYALMLPLAETALEQGEPDKALKFLKTGLKHSPKSAPLLSHLGWALSEKRQYPDALKAGKKAVSIDPSFPYGWYALGVTQKRAGKLEESKKSLLKAVKLQPNVAKYWSTLGAVTSQLGDLAAGQKAFETVLRLDAQNIEALVNLGKLKILRKQSNGAKEFRNVLRLRPKHREAASLLKKYGEH